MIIKEKIEREISFTAEEVETIRKFRDFLQNMDDREWEALEDDFEGNDYIDPFRSDMMKLYNAVDDFYIYAMNREG